jgi:uncharacterized protein (AIM24 family)
MAMGLLLTCLSFVSTARADGARSYISPSGSDNRPCTRNQPCRTFDAAIAKTDAGGEIVALESGTYEPATISKAITLAAAPGADVGIHVSTGNAVTVTASSGDVVVLRGLRLTGPGKNVAGVNGVLLDVTSPNCCVAVNLENSIVSDFDRGVQADLGVASRLMACTPRSKSLTMEFSRFTATRHFVTTRRVSTFVLVARMATAPRSRIRVLS